MLGDTIFRWGWDTRCRNADAVSALRPHLFGGCTLLDAGCGRLGLRAFVRGGVEITGVDMEGSGPRFVQGSIIQLPFGDRGFDFTASVDTLEHLPPPARPLAVRELTRVARSHILVTFPSGPRARALDERFAWELRRRGKPQPSWLVEHLAHPLPDVEEVRHWLGGSKVRVVRSEPVWLAKLLRGLAARSAPLYVGANVLAGLCYPLVRRPCEGYRAILVAEAAQVPT